MLILDPPCRNVFPRHGINAAFINFAFIFEMKEMLNRNAEPRDHKRIVSMMTPRDMGFTVRMYPQPFVTENPVIASHGDRRVRGIEKRNGAMENEGQDCARLSTCVTFV
jgi:hypothetical protein